MDQINENEEIQEFIKEKPCTIKNIQIIIYNPDRNGREVYHPRICGVQIAQGILTFRTVDKNEIFKFKNQFQEPYAEALKALSIP